MAERLAVKGIWAVGRIGMVYFAKVDYLTFGFYQEARRIQSIPYAPGKSRSVLVS